ncbi:GNAT family N-acetyltransferase [Candidatus Thorarchaeota archaeon]|nr:MAG: GNAT family N-acetyltransferase [Candidatus Thorarchaeota archaeon]
MPDTPRRLSIEDYEQVKSLSQTVWEGNDYVPESFPKWISDPNTTTLGIFNGNELVAMLNLEKVEDTTIAWVQGLRVKEGHRDKGYGTRLTKAIVEVAKDAGVRTLWYATSSKNEASQHVAENAGFSLIESNGYFRLYQPYPDHAKPSPSIIPLQIDTNRLHEILLTNPDLIESTVFPIAWKYDFKSLEGITRLSKNATIKVIIDESGNTEGVYFMTTRKRKDELTAAYTIYASNRSIFVDIISRTIDEANTLSANRAVYFLGPRGTEWASSLGFVDEEFRDRKFLLYELNPTVN